MGGVGGVDPDQLGQQRNDLVGGGHVSAHASFLPVAHDDQRSGGAPAVLRRCPARRHPAQPACALSWVANSSAVSTRASGPGNTSASWSASQRTRYGGPPSAPRTPTISPPRAAPPSSRLSTTSQSPPRATMATTSFLLWQASLPGPAAARVIGHVSGRNGAQLGGAAAGADGRWTAAAGRPDAAGADRQSGPGCGAV